jgi:hypothetical protein
MLMQKKFKPRQGRQKMNRRFYLSPLPGLGWFVAFDPRLTPWATICRASGASERKSIWTGRKRKFSVQIEINK